MTVFGGPHSAAAFDVAFEEAALRGARLRALLTEARGGPLGDEMFGERRLRRTLAECAGSLCVVCP
ncbi:hypothetical protein AB0O75_50720, partial [Streptomyces sp. NPDC088921]|uniref:hypothetical protein n=1 Tax=Streptomyces sp. NPDC088921 TaxID=3155062 RepID=UPI0034456744